VSKETDRCSILPLPPLARLLGLSLRTAERLAQQGVLVRVSRGRYDVPGSIQSYIAHMLTQAPGQPEEQTGDLVEARRRLYEAQTRRIHLENETRQGELIETHVVEGYLARIALIYGTQLDSLAGRLAGELAPAMTPAEARQKLFGECRRIRAATAGELERYAEELSAKAA
jgi:hypothetical protein